MPQRAGRFDRRITIQVRTPSHVRGNNTYTWADLKTVFADYTPVTAREQYRSGQRFAAKVGTFRIRWTEDLTPSPATHRIVYRDEEWSLTGVQEVGRREAWDLMAEVRGTTGGG